MMLSEPPETSVPALLEHDVVPTVTTRDFALALAREGTPAVCEAPFHLKVDTGMNRIGVRAEDAPEFARGLAGVPGLQLEGTYTHFATADAPGDWDFERQLERFADTLGRDANGGRRPRDRPRGEQPGHDPAPGVALRHGALRHRDLRTTP